MGGVCYVRAGQEPCGHWVLVVPNVEHENNATPVFPGVQIKNRSSTAVTEIFFGLYTNNFTNARHVRVDRFFDRKPLFDCFQ